MVNVEARKSHTVLAVAVALCLCAVFAIAAPAYAFYYVHGNDYGVKEDTNGAMEIVCTVDDSAAGGAARTNLIFIPVNGTPAQCLDQMITSSESQNGLAAIHNYEYAPASEYIKDGLSNGTWTCTVYEAAAQAPGTQAEYDGTGTEVTDLDSTVLQRYDSVVFKAKA